MMVVMGTNVAMIRKDGGDSGALGFFGAVVWALKNTLIFRGGENGVFRHEKLVKCLLKRGLSRFVNK